MIVKVCGMRDAANIASVAALPIRWMGFIFYPPSSRHLLHGDTPNATRRAIHALPPSIERVGVFVNETSETMLALAETYQLSMLQLHGEESPEACHAWRERGFRLIKSLPMADRRSLEQAESYASVVDYLLFDTPCQGYGGSGKRFDWKLLDGYRGSAPFLLSGGIGIDSVASLRHISHPKMVGVDLNSRFESAPAVKDVTQLALFLTQLVNQQK